MDKEYEWYFNKRLWNVYKDTLDGIYLIPTIKILPWKKHKQNEKFFGKDKYNYNMIIMFCFLFWEFAATVGKHNYRNGTFGDEK